MRLDGILKLVEMVVLAKSSQKLGQTMVQNAVSYVVVLMAGLVVALVAGVATLGLLVAGAIGWWQGFPLPILLVLGGTGGAMLLVTLGAVLVLTRAKQVSPKVQEMLHSEDILERHTPTLDMGREMLEAVVPDEVLRWKDAFFRGWDKAAGRPYY